MKKQPNKPIIISKVPTEKDIESKLIKSETVPVAFRIDELTYAALDLYAKFNNTTLSTLENALHDTFVDQSIKDAYDDDATLGINQIRRNALNLYLDRMATKIAKTSEADLIADYLESFIITTYYQRFKTYPTKDQFNELCKNFTTEFNTKHPSGYAEASNSVFYLGIGLTNDDTFVEDQREIYEEENKDIPEDERDYPWEDFILYVPTEKWAIVSAIFQEYERKFKQLFGKDASHCFIYHSPSKTFEDECDRVNLEKIANLIDETSVKKLPTALAGILKMPTFAETVCRKR